MASRQKERRSVRCLILAAAVVGFTCHEAFVGGQFSKIRRCDRHLEGSASRDLDTRLSASGPANEDVPAQTSWATFAASVCILIAVFGLLPGAAIAQDEEQAEPQLQSYIERNPPVAPPEDDVAPDIPMEERVRRWETPSKQVATEEWYEDGKAVFIAKCSGCHMSGYNKVRPNYSLFSKDMERHGYKGHPEKIMEIMRYGKGKMPGFAKDCAEKSEYTQCGVIVNLSEENLMDVEDFIINRMNDNWSGRG
eukprot:TRINITY_DN6766_c3_g1_i2.p1 TRINITY_DN6766_c3_g1~~TRINITY_DN6766_c3_g1_i2.p1  ORF type:complete len:251 (+),score=55.89 TRINITY_DN6766_c3_g1_i2:64-816(+)